MKKIIITAVLAVAMAAGAFAAPKKVNAAILANFETEFKMASNVTWIVTHDYTKAAFTAGNTNMEVYYSSAGEIIGKSRSITLDELPVNAKRIFAKKFAGYEAKEAIRFDGFDEAAYYISGENKKESVIIKVTDSNEVSLFKKTKK